MLLLLQQSREAKLTALWEEKRESHAEVFTQMDRVQRNIDEEDAIILQLNENVKLITNRTDELRMINGEKNIQEQVRTNPSSFLNVCLPF